MDSTAATSAEQNMNKPGQELWAVKAGKIIGRIEVARAEIFGPGLKFIAYRLDGEMETFQDLGMAKLFVYLSRSGDLLWVGSECIAQTAHGEYFYSPGLRLEVVRNGVWACLNDEGQEIARVYPHPGGVEAHMVRPEEGPDSWLDYPIIRGSWEEVSSEIKRLQS